ncbi:MAG: hypothetical protein ACLFPM_04270 [Candidatus Izemoplasmatales bacterium]
MKCIFIEGLPGSGKTSFAKRLYEDLKAMNMKVHFFTEGNPHPIDLAWIAIFKEKDLIELYDKFPSLVPVIQDELIKEDGLYLLAYTKIKIDQDTKDFYDYCEQFEIYKVNDLNIFLDTHTHRYGNFVDGHHLEDDIFIFECVLIQNHMNELLINYQASQEEINQYFDQLMKPFKDVKLQIIYIKQNQIENTLKRITDLRRSTDKNLYKDWIDHVIDYVERNISYTGYKGVLDFFKNRQVTELALLRTIKDQVDIIPLEDDYEKVYQLLKKKVIK